MALRNTKFTFEELKAMLEVSKKVFFIGIGGISMSGIAEFCLSLGKEIYGYDRERSERTAHLEEIATVRYFSTPDSIQDMDMVVYTNAIDEHNLEYRRAKQLKIPLVSRANLLGYIANLHRARIGVSGMHGKSTTTSLLCHIYKSAKKNPTVFCGAKMKNCDTGYRFGGRECCIFEACEYQRSFLCLPATDALVLNMELDHPDYFFSTEDVVNAFQEYISHARRAFINCDNELCKRLSHKNAITFGFCKDACYRGEIIKEDECGTTVLVYRGGSLLSTVSIPLFGKHNAYNALGAFAVAHTDGIPIDIIKKAISTFQGVKDRTELKGKTDTGADIFVDYAHHPTEIRASLSAFKQMGYKNILCIFQPHTFSRTFYLYNEFTTAFEDAGELVFFPTFSAREENIYELSEENFALDCGGTYESNIEKIKHRVAKTHCDAVVLMGAGDLSRILLRG